ncbi:proline-rich protein 2-like [Manis pentadactyla]|uniref:proline-rich protein 2-like n=1 Tax=Manis pentadactyla TaxID=143292 RepID=UPI00255C7FB1|nr:proline-rich protein 2-like [Manis pentadactyla]
MGSCWMLEQSPGRSRGLENVPPSSRPGSPPLCGHRQGPSEPRPELGGQTRHPRRAHPPLSDPRAGLRWLPEPGSAGGRTQPPCLPSPLLQAASGGAPGCAGCSPRPGPTRAGPPRATRAPAATDGEPLPSVRHCRGPRAAPVPGGRGGRRRGAPPPPHRPRWPAGRSRPSRLRSVGTPPRVLRGLPAGPSRPPPASPPAAPLPYDGPGAPGPGARGLRWRPG